MVVIVLCHVLKDLHSSAGEDIRVLEVFEDFSTLSLDLFVL